MKTSSNTISKNQVKHLAKLSNVQLTQTQINKYQQDLSNVVAYMKEIKNLDVSSIKGTSRVTEEINVLREDEVKKSFTQQQALQNAKRTYQGYFVVPYLLSGKK